MSPLLAHLCVQFVGTTLPGRDFLDRGTCRRICFHPTPMGTTSLWPPIRVSFKMFSHILFTKDEIEKEKELKGPLWFPHPSQQLLKARKHIHADLQNSGY